MSDESGRPEVYVQSFPASSGKVQVSTQGGADPRWRRDGKELFYLAADHKLMAVEVKTRFDLRGWRAQGAFPDACHCLTIALQALHRHQGRPAFSRHYAC